MPGRASAALGRAADRWLFRVGPPEAAPIVLRQRRIFVFPTPAGAAFAAALGIMLLASINYSLSLGYALTFLLGGIGVASMVHAFRNLLHLDIRPGRADPVFRGAPAEFRFIVTNNRGERRPSLRLKAQGARTDFDLPANDGAEVVLPCPTHRRGWLAPGRVVLETTWPIGLVRAWSVFVPDIRCLVLPQPEAEPPPLPEGSADSRGRRSGRTGDDDFAGLRAHQAADSPRHIAWKVIARGGPMLTKQFAGMEGGDLALEWDRLPAQMDVEARLERLTAWVVAAEARGQPFSLALPGHFEPLGSGAAHRRACLQRLALHGIDDASA